jgi:hypothetical protein
MIFFHLCHGNFYLFPHICYFCVPLFWYGFFPFLLFFSFLFCSCRLLLMLIIANHSPLSYSASPSPQPSEWSFQEKKCDNMLSW